MLFIIPYFRHSQNTQDPACATHIYLSYVTKHLYAFPIRLLWDYLMRRSIKTNFFLRWNVNWKKEKNLLIRSAKQNSIYVWIYLLFLSKRSYELNWKWFDEKCNNVSMKYEYKIFTITQLHPEQNVFVLYVRITKQTRMCEIFQIRFNWTVVLWNVSYDNFKNVMLTFESNDKLFSVLQYVGKFFCIHW